jgi:hypothetical protein
MSLMLIDMTPANVVMLLCLCVYIHKIIFIVYSCIQQEEDSFYFHNGLGIEEEVSEVLHLEQSFIWCCNLDASGSRSETPGKF